MQNVMECDEILNDDFLANLQLILAVKEFWKLFGIWWSYGLECLVTCLIIPFVCIFMSKACFSVFYDVKSYVHASNPDQNIPKSAITQKSPVMKWNLHLGPDKCFYNTHSNSLFSFWPGMKNFWMYWRSAWWSFFISTHQCADTRFKSILFHKTFPVSHSNLFFVFNPRSLLSRVKNKNKCISRLARRIPHHTALVNAAAPSSEPQCTPPPMSPLARQQMCSSAGTTATTGHTIRV